MFNVPEKEVGEAMVGMTLEDQSPSVHQMALGLSIILFRTMVENECDGTKIISLSDALTALIMVESNLQRSTILPSEKANAYKMRLDAMKRQQGERIDLTSAPVGQKLEGKSTREIMAENSPDSHSQIQRYIRLTELVPGLMNLVDEGKIAMRPAVELSYLPQKEQEDLLECISYQDATPSLAQAIKMREFSKEGKLSAEVIESIMQEQKPNQREKISFRADRLRQYKFNSLMDTFDVLKEYNMFKASGPISVEDDQVHQALSEGVDAFQFGGCWEWNDIIDYDYTGNIGLMPIPQNMNDEFTGKIVVFGSKYFYVDNSENTTQEQRDAAVAFLNWFALSDEGKKLVSETCAMISPFKSNDVPCANDIGVSVKKYADAGLTIASYDYAPDDHYSKLGAEMQRYLADQCTRQELADAIEAYWASTTPVQH